MIYQCWLFMGSGLPLWSKQFGGFEQKVDHALIAGLLTATKSFTDQVIGSELKDMILQEGRLHSYSILNGVAAFTVHISNQVDINQLDSILESTNKILIKAAEEENIDVESLETASFNLLQRFIELSTPILDTNLSEAIVEFVNELVLIHDESVFDQGQLTLLKEVPSIVPFLVKNECSLTIRDLKTQKIHFQQLYSRMDPKKAQSIYKIIDQMEHLNFLEDDLIQFSGFVILSGTATAIFKIKEVENNLFVIFKDRVQLDQFTQFQRLVVDIKKRVQNFYDSLSSKGP